MAMMRRQITAVMDNWAKEKELREKYPAVKAAYENYLNLLKLTGEFNVNNNRT